MIINLAMMYDYFLIKQEFYKSFILLTTYTLLHSCWIYVRETNFKEFFEKVLVTDKLETLRNRTRFEITLNYLNYFLSFLPGISYANLWTLGSFIAYAIFSSKAGSALIEKYLLKAISFLPSIIQTTIQKGISKEDLDKALKWNLKASIANNAVSKIKNSYSKDSDYEQRLANCSSEEEVQRLLLEVHSRYNRKYLNSNKSIYIFLDKYLHVSILVGISVGFQAILGYLQVRTYFETLEAKLLADRYMVL